MSQRWHYRAQAVPGCGFDHVIEGRYTSADQFFRHRFRRLAYMGVPYRIEIVDAYYDQSLGVAEWTRYGDDDWERLELREERRR